MPTATTSASAEIPPARIIQILAAATCAGHAAAESQDTGRRPRQSRHKGAQRAAAPRICFYTPHGRSRAVTGHGRQSPDKKETAELISVVSFDLLIDGAIYESVCAFSHLCRVCPYFLFFTF